MKKILAALLALFVLCASAAWADRIEPEEPQPPLLGTFRETAWDLWSLCSDWNGEAIVATVEQDGNYFRVVALYDDHAKALSRSRTSYLLEEYALDLPVSYIERITAKPVEESELNALAGKTVGEAAVLGYTLCGSGGGEFSPVTVSLTKGFFDYEFEVDISFKDYMDRLDRNEQDTFEDLVIKGYESCCGLSSLALDLRFRADGTLDPGTLEMEEHQSY